MTDYYITARVTDMSILSDVALRSQLPAGCKIQNMVEKNRIIVHWKVSVSPVKENWKFVKRKFLEEKVEKLRRVLGKYAEWAVIEVRKVRQHDAEYYRTKRRQVLPRFTCAECGQSKIDGALHFKDACVECSKAPLCKRCYIKHAMIHNKDEIEGIKILFGVADKRKKKKVEHMT